MTTNKGYWLTCDDCKYRMTDDLYRQYPCKLSHKEIASATSVDGLTGRTVCNLKVIKGKEMPEIENDDRKIWKCECGWNNIGSRNICDKCKEPKPNYNNSTEPEFTHDYTENIKEQTYKISECVSRSAIKIQELEKEKAKMKFYDSLLNAVQQAGGSTSWIKEDTTLKELCDSLATNNVRFIHNSATVSKEPNRNPFFVESPNNGI